MNCEECEVLISLQNELTEVERRHLEAHLNTCPGCQAFSKSFESDQALFRKASHFEITPLDEARLADKVMERVFGQTAEPETFGGWVRWLRYGFAAVTLCVTFLFYAEWTAYDAVNVGQEYSENAKEASLIPLSTKDMRKEGEKDQVSIYKLLQQNNSK